MQIPRFPSILCNNKNIQQTQEVFEKIKYLLISNTDLIQSSFTKANHEIFIHFNFFPPWPYSTLWDQLYSHSLWIIKPGLTVSYISQISWQMMPRKTRKCCCIIAFQCFLIGIETSHSFVLTHGPVFSKTTYQKYSTDRKTNLEAAL